MNFVRALVLELVPAPYPYRRVELEAAVAAIDLGNLARLKTLCEAHGARAVELEWRLASGASLLERAAELGRDKIVQYLLSSYTWGAEQTAAAFRAAVESDSDEVVAVLATHSFRPGSHPMLATPTLHRGVRWLNAAVVSPAALFFRAILDGNSAVVCECLNRGASSSPPITVTPRALYACGFATPRGTFPEDTAVYPALLDWLASERHRGAPDAAAAAAAAAAPHLAAGHARAALVQRVGPDRLLPPGVVAVEARARAMLAASLHTLGGVGGVAAGEGYDDVDASEMWQVVELALDAKKALQDCSPEALTSVVAAGDKSGADWKPAGTASRVTIVLPT